ncbi:hypothetical protein ACQCT5_06800 [Sutcliffiella halmapala]
MKQLKNENVTSMTHQVEKEFDRWKEIFQGIEDCRVIENGFKDNRLLIASINNVPWDSSLKPQYNESPKKIGYLFKQNSGIKLAIDFPIETITKELIQRTIFQTDEIPYSPLIERAPGRSSYWRYKSSDNFNTLILVIRNPHLSTIKISNEEIINLLQEIISLANGEE